MKGIKTDAFFSVVCIFFFASDLIQTIIHLCSSINLVFLPEGVDGFHLRPPSLRNIVF